MYRFNRHTVKDIVLRLSVAGLVIVLICMCVDLLIARHDSLSVSAGSSFIAEVQELDESVPAAVRNFEMNLRYDNGNEIIRHYDVRGKNENSNIYGYVQIWKAGQGLEHYLKISREYMSANVFGFREENVKINSEVWVKWEYIVSDTYVTQGFYEKNNEITICSLCVPYKEKTYAFDKIFLELIESIIA